MRSPNSRTYSALLFLLSFSRLGATPYCSVEIGSERPLHWRFPLKVNASIIPADALAVMRMGSSYETSVEARYGQDGMLLCASPLNGANYPFWPYELSTLQKGLPDGDPRRGPGYWLFRFEAPFKRDDPLPVPRICVPEMTGLAAIQNGVSFYRKNQRLEAIACFDFALRLLPESAAAHEAAALMSKDDETKIAHYSRSTELFPTSLASRIRLGRVLRQSGDSTRSEAILRAVLDEQPPLDIRRETCGDLAVLYRGTRARRKAVEAERCQFSAMKEIAKRAAGLVDGSTLCFEAEWLAEREEEIGDYEAASGHFSEAVALSIDPKVSEAVRYEAELGIARCARRLSQEKEAARVCSRWRSNLHFRSLSLDNAHWEGKQLTSALGVFMRFV